MIRLLVIGCHGLLGQALIERLGPDFGDVHGIDLHRSSYFTGLKNYSYHPVDITDREQILRQIRRISPRVILHTAAMTSVDACEVQREHCWKVNVRGTENVVDAARRIGARVVLLSSDHVFNGEAGPYTELDRPDPLSYFGRSKHAAENAVIGGGVEHTIVRTAMVYGRGRYLKPGFVTWLINKLREGRSVKVVTDQMSNVTFVGDLAVAMKRVVSLPLSGVYHIAGREIISRYDFARRVAEAYNLDDRHLKPTLTRLMELSGPKPLQCGLVVDKAQKELNLTFANVDEGLRMYRQQEATFN
jgi:dTDP-4-dehydrorhamnose reductase